uniref:Skp1-related protein n=1 Tax=Steinernema glaseri TaxID=37863 RepID=A0A1I7YA72_9BILA
METIELVTAEGRTVRVEKELALKSGTIRHLLETLAQEDGSIPSEPLPLPNCAEKHLRAVIAWLERHRDDVPQTQEDIARQRFDLAIPDDDRKAFQAFHIDDIANILTAANYLDIQSLIDMLVKYVAKFIDDNNSSPQTLAKALNIKPRN